MTNPNPIVLVVDDDEDIRLLARLTLSSMGVDIVEAASGEAAVALVEDGAAPDVVLLDLKMGGMDGYDVRRSLAANARTAGTPVLLFSAQLALQGEIPDDVPAFAGVVRKQAMASDLAELLPELLPHHF